MRSLKVLGACLLVTASIFLAGCPEESTGGSSSGGGGGGGSSCTTGNCLNNGQCCPRARPNYTYGGHGYAAGCYASCPYVGDCGASTQCF